MASIDGYGFIMTSRKLYETDPFWKERRVFSRHEAWEDLRQSAAWKDHRRVVGGQVVELKRGEVLASLSFLAKRWKWGQKKVRIFLELLGEMDRITTQETTQAGTRYLLVNYDKYNPPGQGEDIPKGTLGADPGHTQGTPGAGREVREEQKEQKEPQPPPRALAEPDTDQAEAVAQMRLDLNVEASRLADAPGSRFRAAAASIIDGDDTTAWRDPRTTDGAPISWAERPRLLRMALRACISEGALTSQALAAKVRYHAKKQLAPFPDKQARPAPAGSEAAEVLARGRVATDEDRPSTEKRTGRATRADGYDPEAEKLRKEAEDVERVEAWAEDNADEARRIAAAVELAVDDDPKWKGAPKTLIEMAKVGEYRRRILEHLKPKAATG